MNKIKRIEELNTELSLLEASYDADSDEEFRLTYLESIRQINKELIRLGSEENISKYV